MSKAQWERIVRAGGEGGRGREQREKGENNEEKDGGGQAFIVDVKQDCWFGHGAKTVSEARITRPFSLMKFRALESNDVDAPSLLLPYPGSSTGPSASRASTIISASGT